MNGNNEQLQAASKPLVRHLMTADVFTVCEDDSINALKDLMSWQEIRHVPVLDAQERLVGLVSQTDYLKVAISKLAHIPQSEEVQTYANILIKTIMGRKLTTIGPESTLSEAAEIMKEHRFGCLPVVGPDGLLVGIITERDFVRAFCDWTPEFIRRN